MSRFRFPLSTALRSFQNAGIALASAALFFAFGMLAARAEGDGWELVSNASGLSIYNRTRKDSPVKEFKAIGPIAAPPASVERVLEDTVEYPHFMPYVSEARVVSRSGDSLIGYQRISPPFIGDRDYTVKVHTEIERGSDGATTYCRRWQIANDQGPAERKGILRIKANEGYWLLEPAAGGKETRATYCIYCDSGSSMPSALVNMANRTTFPKLFDAVRQQVKLEKYAAPAK